MVILFYFFGISSIFWVMLMLFSAHLIYVLLYFVLFILSLSGIFFILGSYFLGALEIIIYAGSIIVLFLFIIMLMDFNKKSEFQFFFKFYFSLKDILFFCYFMLLILFLYLEYNITSEKNIFFNITSAHDISYYLFGKYCSLVELVSLLLFSSVILVCFFMKKHKYNSIIINKGLK
ncbi:NADH dehydrogenase I chain J [Buchnera aphidicola (Cinara tujafilina)]|uniref:NADH-quinone oxidoreductase subunit J n=1 Tax=Buchnera aphidicola (Cinara tujafilina) TaxID=261317 RepID=F7WZ48_9GAMM|nr:NADH-quinone oxidoreductase subunit J [Buchnera aphidicola]AEH39700.1 NADH dehydrogenase I chain J [Buchnera aphidicola (Cinara tujafilina)]